VPSCSHYAEDAVRQHGAARGLALAIRRLLRCHPFGTSGYDPVP
jgi:putative membrane protein insertion efficiency factor